MQAVMRLAQGDQIGRVSGAPVLPVLDVMDVKPALSIAARHPTAPVSVLHHHPGALGHGAPRPPNTDRSTAGLEYRPHPGVAAQEAPQAS